MYGPDGRAEKDTDYNHSGEDSHEFPHEHEWDWNKTPPRQPGVPVPRPNSSNNPSFKVEPEQNSPSNVPAVIIGFAAWLLQQAENLLEGAAGAI